MRNTSVPAIWLLAASMAWAQGRTMSVQISWKPEPGNRTEFTVSESQNFFDGTAARFGKESDRGSNWSGKVPGTGDYYIYVVAHPAAHYALSVTLK